jgi:aspartate dehydrogenase
MEQKALRVGLIGYGAVGQDVSRLLAERAATDIVLVGALIRHAAYPRPRGCPKVVTTLSALLTEQPHVVVEAAGHEGLREHAPALLRAGIDLILISVGALADPDLLHDIEAAAQQSGAQVKIASGAIGALDALASASLGRLTNVTHTMRKPPKTLLPLEESKDLTEAREIFRGSARQAVRQFPEFLNVAAAVALAGRGFDLTEVRVLADPAVEHSQHEVRAEGEFGSFQLTIESRAISSYGRGARLVAMSILHTLLMRHASLVVG